MLNLLAKVIHLNHLHVVGIVKTDEGATYHVLTAKKKGSTISVVGSGVFASVEEMAAFTGNRLPMLLVFDGKGILNKKIDFNNEQDASWYKSIDFASIYFTSIKEEMFSFMSFCRKNIVDEQLALVRKNGLQVVDIYIGPFLSALLYGSLDNTNVVSGEVVLEFENKKLNHFSKTSEAAEYTIGKDRITSQQLPLYGALIHFFVHPKSVSKTQNATLNVDEILYKKAFEVLGIAMLAGFLVMLLGSYLAIQHYGTKNAELNLQNVYSSESYQRLLDLEKQKENKQRIVNDSGLLSSKFLSFYAYEIIRNIPPQLTLNGLDIRPAEKQTKATAKIAFESGVVLVKGETYNESAFNNWLDSLKKAAWVKDFEILQLKKDKKNKSQFEIRITVKDV